MASNSMNIIVLKEELKDHMRENLHSFISNTKNFKSNEDRSKAEGIYKKMLEGEKKVKEKAAQFKQPPTTPFKGFNLDYFTKATNVNPLTSAIKAHFVQDPKAVLAGYEYFTLKQSTELLKTLTGDDSKNPAAGSGNVKGTRDAGRFGKTSEELNQKNVSTINVTKEQQPKGAGQKQMAATVPAKKGGAGPRAEASGGQASGVNEAQEVEMVENEVYHMHPHMHHPEGPPSDEEDERDDSKNIILHLLWGHQDYFDQKALSKAQAEFNFYRVIQKQWKKTLKRVKMDDLQYQKFDMKMFYGLPRNRPLYAVILTILEQSKDKKPGEEAAQEYYKLRVLEQHMIQTKTLTQIPQGLDIDDGHYNELFQNMQTRFKSSGSQAQMRQAAEFKMVPLFEYLKLKETIITQRNQIDELASRLSGIASQQLAEGDSGFHDLGDRNRPQKLGERFAETFDEAWSGAYESLKPKKAGEDDDESDEQTMDTLQKVVKVIYEFCQKVAKEQITRIVQGMMPSILDPLNAASKQGEKAVPAASDAMKNKTEQMAKEYRKVVASETVKVLQKEILETELKGKLLTEPISKEVQAYVDQCIDLIWYMCIQQPPMEVVWAKPGEKFNREHFRFSGKKGKKYKLTVWPAVFLQKDGPLVAAGYAVPE